MPLSPKQVLTVDKLMTVCVCRLHYAITTKTSMFDSLKHVVTTHNLLTSSSNLQVLTTTFYVRSTKVALVLLPSANHSIIAAFLAGGQHQDARFTLNGWKERFQLAVCC